MNAEPQTTSPADADAEQRSPLWTDIIGQSSATDELQDAILASRDGSGVAHAWILAGAPGSGRSNLAIAFAADLVAGSDGYGADESAQLVLAGTHPDVTIYRTETVVIAVDEVRELVARSYLAPARSNYRVIVVEDADRMSERTANFLLKAIEEPPDSTIWVLCAPSESDLLPTIRSRSRTVRLSIPHADAIAELLTRTLGVDAALASSVAAHSQGHIGMARRLALSAEARDRRDRTVQAALSVRDTSSAVDAAAVLLEVATADGAVASDERNAEEKSALLHTLGIAEGERIPPALRAQLKRLEDDQKRRGRRTTADSVDRVLIDLLSVYRDIATYRLETGAPIINRGFEAALQSAASERSVEDALRSMRALFDARKRVVHNVTPLLVLEAALVISVPQR